MRITELRKNELVEIYAKSLKELITDIKNRNDLSENYKYMEVSYHYCSIVKTLSDKRPELTLSDLKPLTVHYNQYSKEYLEG